MSDATQKVRCEACKDSGHVDDGSVCGACFPNRLATAGMPIELPDAEGFVGCDYVGHAQPATEPKARMELCLACGGRGYIDDIAGIVKGRHWTCAACRGLGKVKVPAPPAPSVCAHGSGELTCGNDFERMCEWDVSCELCEARAEIARLRAQLAESEDALRGARMAAEQGVAREFEMLRQLEAERTKTR